MTSLVVVDLPELAGWCVCEVVDDLTLHRRSRAMRTAEQAEELRQTWQRDIKAGLVPMYHTPCTWVKGGCTNKDKKDHK